MIPATRAVQRPEEGKLLLISSGGGIAHARRADWLLYLQPGDLVIANDGATLPASLAGVHLRTGRAIEVRLAARRSLDAADVSNFTAIVFGEGDFHTPTEHRPAPPPLEAGDRLALGPLRATITRLLDHPRLVALALAGAPDAIWAGLARHGRPIQYAHLSDTLALWDVWTAIAGRAASFEPPSAGFVLDWRALASMRERRVAFGTLTLAAGISSTGDPALDARLPFDEPYDIPLSTADAISRARAAGRRIVAVGTTVVRALEHAAAGDGVVRAGTGIATGRVTPATRLQVVHAILSGVHEPGTSHYELLRAFADDKTLEAANEEMSARGYRTHEFGDSVLIERRGDLASRRPPLTPPPGSFLSADRTMAGGDRLPFPG
jgi:S-adenosylmethionine:tRNA ribosyltransferase-isomerase